MTSTKMTDQGHKLPTTTLLPAKPSRRRTFAELGGLVVFFVVAIVLFDSLGIRDKYARRGADMNWTFDRHHAEPAALAAEARRFGTVSVTGTEEAVPAEGRGRESGYTVLIQLLALAGWEMDYVSLAQLHVIVFLFNSLLFSAAIGLLLRRIWPISFIVLTLLMVFRHQNVTLIYYMLGPWTLVTSFILLAFTSILLLQAWGRRLSVRWAVAFLIVGVVAGAIGFLREGQAYAFVCGCVAFMAMLCLFRRAKFLPSAIGIILIFATFLGIGWTIRKAVVCHRSAHTQLAAKEYGQMYHGHWYVLLYSLGRYENSYGYYSSDYFVIDTINARLDEKNKLRTTDYASREYQEEAKLYYLEEVCAHPGHYAYYLGRSFADYLMFIPYSMFMNRPSRTPNGAHVPVLRDDVEYDEWDFVWYGQRAADGSVPQDRTCLRNLQPRYFYLAWYEWAMFVVMAGFFVIGPVFVVKHYPRDVWLPVIGFYVAFAFYSALRIPIAMHGWGVTLGFYALFALSLALVTDYWYRRMYKRLSATTQRKIRRTACIVAAVALVTLATLRLSGMPLCSTRSGLKPPRPKPVLVAEGVGSYNIIQYGSRYYGLPQGYSFLHNSYK